MSITEIEQQCHVLRQDLKVWEKQFAAQNHGRRAGREDIKADADISQKYKDYNKLRVRLSSKADPQTPSKRVTRPSPALNVGRTPKAPPEPPAFTPTKRKRDDDDAPENSDLAIEFMPPQGPTVIGPTPQRNGIVLGLFDLLSAETPSKRRAALGESQPNVPQTPSRKLAEVGSETSLESRARGERTPLSAGKRFLLDQFVTPKKKKLDDEGTPSTSRGLATPAFLRRTNVLHAIDEDDETTPRPAPWKRRGLGRSLSAMIQAMKKDEDDRLDEEADIMREMEMEEQGMTVPKKSRVPDILVEDSQVVMPLGPDRGDYSEDESDEGPALGPDGKPRRVWKKKGLKRQTRRAIMRPNVTKPKPQQAPETQVESEDEQSGVPETQIHAVGATEADGSDHDGSDYASDASHTPKVRSLRPKQTGPAQDKPTEGIFKAAARKTKATANANYRRLNIKGKAGAGAKGKFSRRR